MKDYSKLGLIYEKHILSEMAFGLSPTAKPITQQQLTEKLFAMSGQGEKPIEVMVISKKRPTKKTEVVPAIYKISRIKGFIGKPYGAMVNKQREAEGKVADFKPTGLLKKNVIRSNEYVEEKVPATGEFAGKQTVYIKVIASGFEESKYVSLEGDTPTLLSKEQGKEYFPSLPIGYTQKAQGVENAVEVRSTAIPNVAGISIAGEEYRISDIPADRAAAFKASGIVDNQPSKPVAEPNYDIQAKEAEEREMMDKGLTP